MLLLLKKLQNLLGCLFSCIKFQFIGFSQGPFASITDKKFVNWTLRIASVHGHKVPLPFIKSVEVKLLKRTHSADHFSTAIFHALHDVLI